MRRALVTGVAIVTVLGLGGGCGGDEPSDPGPAGTAPAPSSTATTGPRPPDTAAPTAPDTAVADDEAAVRAAVDCYWQTIVEANDPPNPDHPGFDRCFTGPALERSRTRTADHLAAGETVKDPTSGTEQFNIQVVFASPLEASLTECVVDDAVIYDAAGSVIDDRVVSLEVEFQLVNDRDGWRVHRSQLVRDQLGRGLCE